MSDITGAERITWQRQAATLLGRLLELAAKQNLPAITWTVHDAGATLGGQVLSLPAGKRREYFAAWKAAITEASGRDPEADREVPLGSGETRLVVSWARLPVRLGAPADQLYPSVTVTLTASIWADDEDEG